MHELQHTKHRLRCPVAASTRSVALNPINTMFAPNPPVPPVGLQQRQAVEPDSGQEPSYSIFGGNDGGNQIIQFYLAPGQAVLSASSSHLLYASGGVVLQRVRRDSDSILYFGDMDELLTNPLNSTSLSYVGLAAPHAGKILPIKVGTRVALLVQNDCYLAYTGAVSHRRLRLQAGVNAEQLLMTRIMAKPFGQLNSIRSTTAFVHAPGSIMETHLGQGDSMYVCTSAIVAVTEGVTVNLPVASGREWLTRQHNTCLVRGPGTVYVSSLPVMKQARRLLNAGRPEIPAIIRALMIVCLFVACTMALHSLNMLALDGQEF